MTIRTVLLHLRIPFSFFLMPVYLFALSLSSNLNGFNMFNSFVCLHLFLYPASNAYNSYFDKDEKSIGGLKHPPPVSKALYYTSLLFDLCAIFLGLMINFQFAIALTIYGLVSKAYSHPAIRIKKYPWTGWLIIGLFQGFFTFLMAYLGINDFKVENLISAKTLGAGFLSSLILWGSYPMTQIYQHEEDRKRGDITLSLLLGIKGTFLFTGICFTLATATFFMYFNYFFDRVFGYYFLVFLSPVVIFFLYWFLKTLKDKDAANFQNTMRLNAISALCMNAFFIFFFLKISNVLNLI